MRMRFLLAGLVVAVYLLGFQVLAQSQSTVDCQNSTWSSSSDTSAIATCSTDDNIISTVCLYYPDACRIVSGFLSDSLVAYWSMTEASGTRQDGVYDDRTARQFARADSEYFERGSAIVLADDTAWAMRFWFKSDDAVFVNYPTLIGQGDGSPTGIRLNNNGVVRLYNVVGDSATEEITGLDVSTLTYYQLTIKADGTDANNISWFVNGSKDSNTDTLANSAVTFQWIGRRAATYHNGAIAHFAVWTDSNTPTDAQITAGFNNGVPVTCSNTTPRPTYCVDLDGEFGDEVEAMGGGTWEAKNAPTYVDGPNLELTESATLHAAVNGREVFRDLDEASTMYFTGADPGISQGDVDRWYAGWFQSEALPGAGAVDTVFGQWVAGDTGFLARILPSDDGCANCFNLVLGDSIHALACDVDASTFGSLAADTQYLYFAKYDATTQKCYASVRSVATPTGTLDEAARSWAPADSTAGVSIGAWSDGTAPFDGLLGPQMMGLTIPSDDGLALWNNGRPIPCHALEADTTGVSGMSHCFPMNELSGDTTDTIAGLTLTATNAPTHGVPTEGPAVTWPSSEFSGVNQGVSLADNPAISSGDRDLTVGCLVRPDAFGGTVVLMSRFGAAGSREWRLSFNGTPKATFSILDSNDAAVYSPQSDGAPTGLAWQWVWGGHDSVNNEAWVELDGVRKTDTSASGLGVPADTAATLTVGISGANSYDLDGRIAACFYYTDRLLTRSEMRRVEAAGTFDRLAPDLRTNLVAAPRMDEVGVWRDAATSSHAWAAVGTPTIAEGVLPVPGLVLAAADFEAADSEYLAASEALLDVADGTAFSYFFRFNAETVSFYYLNSSTTDAKVAVAPNFIHYWDDGTLDQSAAGLDNMIVGRWYSVGFTASDDATSDITYYTDGAAIDTDTQADAAFSFDELGRYNATGADGLAAQTITFTSELTAAQAALWHHSYATCSQIDNLVSASALPAYYACCDLSELSGNRTCRKGAGGTITLTETSGTIDSADGQLLSDAGRSMGAVQFDNASYFTAPLVSESQFDEGISTAFTLESLVQGGSTAAGDTILDKDLGEYRINYSSADIIIYMGGSGNNGRTPGTLWPSTDTAFHQLITRYDGSKASNASRLRMWWDGTEIALDYTGTIPASLTSDVHKFTVGARRAGTNFWNNGLGPQRLFRGARSPTDIVWLCNADPVTSACHYRTEAELAAR